MNSFPEDPRKPEHQPEELGEALESLEADTLAHQIEMAAEALSEMANETSADAPQAEGGAPWFEDPRQDRDAMERQQPASDNSMKAAQAEVIIEPEASRQGMPVREKVDSSASPIAQVIDVDRGPKLAEEPVSAVVGREGKPAAGKGRTPPDAQNDNGSNFHRRVKPVSFAEAYHAAYGTVRRNLALAMVFTVFVNVLVLAVPIYLFQMSDRVLTSRSLDTLVMLTVFVLGAIVAQVLLDAVRRLVLMRTAVEAEVQLGAPVLAAAARASLNSNGREYQTLADLQHIRSFLTSGTLLALLDAPLAPLFVLVVYLIHPHLGFIVIGSSVVLLIIARLNQKVTAQPFGEANSYLSRANSHLESMSRNAQIINALAMIPEVVRIWGKDTAGSLKAQVRAQDLNIAFAAMSKATRLFTQVSLLGWGAFLALSGELTGGMVIAASIVSGRALGPIEGAIEGWHSVVQARSALDRVRALLQNSPLNFARLRLPSPQGRLDVERVLFVPPPNKKVILNGISFSLNPGDSMAIIGSSGAGKTTLGKMLVGSVHPTSGSVRLDLMDLRNWDQRQFGENVGYLPQDVQLFPGTIKANIARMRDDIPDRAIYDAAVLADVHELISTLPQGYETYVAGDGAPLSGGQKQRVALARAFLGNPRLVVLDEPNSNLDSQGELALARALKHAKEENITVVTITQRPSLLNCVDKIMVLNNGAVALFGARDKVMAALSQKRGAGVTPVMNPIPGAAE
ncbi:type I secretion system permease/ATPase [Devosia sp. PTR5]|uniref:Type I secretion system permease/ATPase n=1 Tax=Devosia oryzisoli TaxID=2774138 RepID=A0A927FXX3_9HYPH|nr:type I secretion system permease/ATPase [Devosia oryzisoli]MBD8066808.1 type I secretion system permease/ATPase [Devosia oryzisoli]